MAVTNRRYFWALVLDIWIALPFGLTQDINPVGSPFDLRTHRAFVFFILPHPRFCVHVHDVF